MSLTPEQLALRKTGITSTDITRIVGESPFGGPCDVYREKISEEPPSKPTLAQRIGDALEPLVCELIAEQFNLASVLPGRTVQHPILPWALSTPDRIVPGFGVAEAKVKTIRFGIAEWLDEEAPPAWVVVQCAWHMAVTCTPVCYSGALLGAQPRFWIVESDPQLEAMLLEAGQEFHETYVLPRVPPPVDGSEGARRMLAAVWPHSKASTIKATPAAELAAKEYFEAAKLLKVAEGRKEQAAQELLAFAQDFERVEGDGWRLQLSEQAARHVEYDAKAYRRFDLRPATTHHRKGRAA